VYLEPGPQIVHVRIAHTVQETQTGFAVTRSYYTLDSSRASIPVDDTLLIVEVHLIKPIEHPTKKRAPRPDRRDSTNQGMKTYACDACE
jgi:hypothetical protein